MEEETIDITKDQAVPHVGDFQCRVVSKFFGLGFGVEKVGICSDVDTEVQWDSWHFKIFLGPLVTTFNVNSKPKKSFHLNANTGQVDMTEKETKTDG